MPGNPRISYYDYTNKDLNYSAWNGAAWTTTTVDSGGDVGQYTSLALDSSGNPCISYYDNTNKVLKFAEWDGASWIKLTADSSGDVGQYTSLALGSTGAPRISYYDNTNKDLKYTAWNGGGWTTTTVDSGGDVGQYTSLALDSSGNPCISYYDNTNKVLKFAVWNGSGFTTTTVDRAGDVGQYTSLALDSSGNPYISYYDNTNKDLKFSGPTIMPDFSATPVSGPAPLTVQFTGTASGTVSPPKWGWVFGDGGSSFEQSPSHTYTTPGTYTVSLAAYDTAGINISTRVGYITVTQPLTTAGFTGTPTTGTAPLTVKFTDTSTNNPTSWAWDFGDGITTNATKQNPVHTYTAGGTYTVKLIASRDGNPNTSTRNNYITVSPSYYLSQPVITTVTPLSGARNQTVPFTVTGRNFQPGFTTVEFRNQTTGIIAADLGTVTATFINGTITIPYNASAGYWNLRVATTSGGDTVALKKLTVTNLSAPAITSIVPATGIRNTTVMYTIVGTNFEPGLTNVTFVNSTGSVLNTTMLTGVTATRITGTIMVPPNASIGLYNVNISTVDGGSTPGTSKFTVARAAAPAITSITPATGSRNASVMYTIAGTNFQPGATNVTFVNATGFVLNTTVLTNVTATRIAGTILVPPSAWVGAYNVNISTVDGGSTPGTGKFAVSRPVAPAITAITPAAGPRNATVGLYDRGNELRSRPDERDVRERDGFRAERDRDHKHHLNEDHRHDPDPLKRHDRVV